MQNDEQETEFKFFIHYSSFAHLSLPSLIPNSSSKMTYQEKLEELRQRNARAENGGGEERRARQKSEGKIPARQRLELLFDEGTFEEIDKLVEHRCQDFGMAEQHVPGDGVVAGFGRIEGRLTYAFAQDFTVFWRLTKRVQRREDLQNYGPGH